MVRGAPFADAPAGIYGWAETTESLSSDLAGAIYHASKDLARLALDAGDEALATWATGQGLLVWPSDETLHELLLSAAAASPERSKLPQAWARIVGLLGPDDPPSERLTTLYHHLRDTR
ncbi:MAG: hypothetical protein ACYC1D_01070 [Acidimicrobiales bacterium]